MSVNELITKRMRKGKVLATNTIIGDSIVKYIEVEDCYTQAIRGARTSDLANAIENKVIRVNFETIIVHVGTNNLYQCTISEFIHEYCKLLRVIRSKRPSCKIIVSAILPRPMDDLWLNDKRLAFNISMQDLASQYDAQYINLMKLAPIYVHHPKLQFFSDGLHLNNNGILAATVGFRSVLHKQ